MSKVDSSTSEWQVELLKCYSNEPDVTLLPKEVLFLDSTSIIKMKKICADSAYKVVCAIYNAREDSSEDNDDCQSSGDEVEWMATSQ